MSEHRGDITISVQDVVRFLLRGLLPALLIAGLVAGAAYVYTAQQPELYQAQSTLLVTRSAPGLNQFGLGSVTAAPIDLGAYRVAAVSDGVLGDALSLLGNESPSVTDVMSLRSRVRTSTEAGVRDSSLLRVEAVGPTPEDAIARANAVADALVGWDEARSTESLVRVITSLEQQIVALGEQIRTLQAMGTDAPDVGAQVDGLVRVRAEQQQQLAYARALAVSAQGLLGVLQYSDSTRRQIAPRPVMTAGVVALLMTVLVYGALLLRAAFNTRLRTPEDVATATGLPVLAEFPSLTRQGDPRRDEAASYLRASLLFRSEDAKPRVIMVTSAVAGDGKSTVAAALAESLARYGYATLLIDGDLRSPSLARHFEVVGMADRAATTEQWLTDPASIAGHVLTVSFGDDGQLDVLHQRRPVERAAELLGTRLRRVMPTISEYDVVVIDTPPVLAVSDALTIAPQCTSAILVVDTVRTDRRRLHGALEALGQVGVSVAGVVVNRVAGAHHGPTYGRGYGPRAQRERPLVSLRDAAATDGPVVVRSAPPRRPD